jgi:hypothetical protein
MNLAFSIEQSTIGFVAPAWSRPVTKDGETIAYQNLVDRQVSHAYNSFTFWGRWFEQ